MPLETLPEHRPLLSVQAAEGDHGQRIHITSNGNAVEEEASQTAIVQPPKKKRLVSLDGVRGLTVAVMILVDNLGEWLPSINHSPWNIVTLADFVMPYFLFMVGCSMSLAFRKYHKGLLKKVFTRTAKLFILGLLTQGSDFPSLGTHGINLKTVRIPGILQRIAWAYFVVALIVMYVPKIDVATASNGKRSYFYAFRVHAYQWAAASFFFWIYLVMMLGVSVPSWDYQYEGVTMHVECGTKGDLTPGCSATRFVDVKLIGWEHMYHSGEFARSTWCSSCSPMLCPKKLLCPEEQTCPEPTRDAELPFLFTNNCSDEVYGCAADWCAGRLDPEGTLSSMPAVFTTYIGFHFGITLAYFTSHRDRLSQWVPQSLALIVLGLLIQTSWPANKQLWSPAYVFIMSGACGITLAVFYCLLDCREMLHKSLQAAVTLPAKLGSITVLDPFLRPFVWVGMNTIFIYLLSPAGGLWEAFQDYFYWGNPDNNLKDSAYRHVFCGDTYAMYNGTKITSQSDCSVNAVPACVWGRDSVCGSAMFAGHHQRWAQLLWVLSEIAFWFGVAGYLHHIKWYWAL